MSDPAEPQAPQQLALTVLGPAPPSLDSFLGHGNHETVGRLRQLVRLPLGRMWLTGARGTGKSHLIAATRAALTSAGQGVVQIESSASGLRAALQALQALQAQQAQHADVAVLLFDDADAIAGDAVREALLMQLLNEHVRHAQECGCVLAARTHPGASTWALPDLRSRLLAAEQFRLVALEDTDREVLLVSRAAAVGLALHADVLAFLLGRLPRDAANLLAAMDRLDLASWRSQRRLTVPFVRSVLELPR